MKTVSSKQLAVGRKRCERTVRRSLPTVLLFLFVCSSLANAAGAWKAQRSGALSWLHAVYFLDENRGWAVGGSGVLLSTTDGGKVWRALPRPAEDALHDVYFSDERNGWLVCERSIYDLKTNDEPRTYLLRTADGGVTWNKVNVIGKDVDARLVRALFTSEGRGWAFGEAGALYTTRDGGANWERQRVPTRYLLLGGWFLNAEQGWLVGAGATLLQTSDGGETWHTGALLGLAPVSNNNAEAVRVRFTAASFVDKRKGWAVGAEGRVFATRDGGRTWAAQVSNVASDLSDVKFLDEFEGWAVGAQGTLIHTTDGGVHWRVEPSGTTHALERLCFVGRTRGWAVGFGGTILSYTPDAATPQRPILKRQ
ncbi:MAG: hypothetical protein QOJ02_140 [Acidobacteriota bacterium]|jgi:photosystem II stability/assembly factor-like uncharacterized protein|nr:hypothetical protein [Acidobacteriota bacterium]